MSEKLGGVWARTLLSHRVKTRLAQVLKSRSTFHWLKLVPKLRLIQQFKPASTKLRGWATRNRLQPIESTPAFSRFIDFLDGSGARLGPVWMGYQVMEGRARVPRANPVSVSHLTFWSVADRRGMCNLAVCNCLQVCASTWRCTHVSECRCAEESWSGGSFGQDFSNKIKVFLASSISTPILISVLLI